MSSFYPNSVLPSATNSSFYVIGAYKKAPLRRLSIPLQLRMNERYQLHPKLFSN